MTGKTIKIHCTDGYLLDSTVFEPDPDKAKGVVIICSALGVERRFYHTFAQYLCERHFTVITFDYRGTGGSKPGAFSGPLLLADWGRQDIDAVIHYAESLPGAQNIFLMGHSVGGQLFCLARNAVNLKGAVLVGASFPWWRRWPFPRKLLVFFFLHILVPVLGAGRKKFPSRFLGLSKENLPAGLVTTWAEWARDPDYVTAEKFRLDTRLFEILAIPILLMGFDDDTYAPEKSIQRLQSALKSADVQVRYLRGKDLHPKGIGHFGFFRASGRKNLWPDTVDWLQALILPPR
ncbi:MAG: alpha/beta fold hydrolase [Desulfotignum sp.]|jgi:predicted alpha/beta hydrolase|nr:alpha/beta fold hydrolase [Desulfotignum sp.]